MVSKAHYVRNWPKADIELELAKEAANDPKRTFARPRALATERGRLLQLRQ